MHNKPNNPPYQLKANEIHLWLVDDHNITDLALLREYQSWLDEEERQRYRRFYFDRHRKQFLITRALVRFGLTSCLGRLSPAQWSFKKNQYGRPSIGNKLNLVPSLEFNLSHTRGMVVMAVAVRGQLGVDVENVHRRVDPVTLAKRFFAAPESNALFSLPSPRQRQRFFDYWTLKESYIKARGMGLAIPFSTFWFELSERHNAIGFSVSSRAHDTAQGWRFWQLDGSTHHQIALAHRQSSARSIDTIRCFNVVPGASINAVEHRQRRSSTCTRN